MGSHRLKFSYPDPLVQLAWRALGSDYSDPDLSERWVAKNIAPSTQLAMATAWLREALSNHERAITLEAERVAFASPEAVAQREHVQAERQAKYDAIYGTEEERLERRLRDDRVLREHSRQMWQDFLDEYRREVIVEWTDELLSQTIRLSDGSKTTWGEATVKEHTERLEMFTVNAVANTEGAARHSLAIAALEQAGVICLNELRER